MRTRIPSTVLLVAISLFTAAAKHAPASSGYQDSPLACEQLCRDRFSGGEDSFRCFSGCEAHFFPANSAPNSWSD